MLQADGKEADLAKHIQSAQRRVHEALLDNLNSKAALDSLLDLVKDTNKYLADRQGSAQGQHPQHALHFAWHPLFACSLETCISNMLPDQILSRTAMYYPAAAPCCHLALIMHASDACCHCWPSLCS